MFERFTGEARAVVTAAVARAERDGDPRVEPEHLLLAVAGLPGSDVAARLADLGLARRT